MEFSASTDGDDILDDYDDLFDEERQVLQQYNVLDSLVQVDLAKYPNQLKLLTEKYFS